MRPKREKSPARTVHVSEQHHHALKVIAAHSGRMIYEVVDEVLALGLVENRKRRKDVA